MPEEEGDKVAGVSADKLCESFLAHMAEKSAAGTLEGAGDRNKSINLTTLVAFGDVHGEDGIELRCHENFNVLNFYNM